MGRSPTALLLLCLGSGAVVRLSAVRLAGGYRAAFAVGSGQTALEDAAQVEASTTRRCVSTRPADGCVLQ